MSPEVTEAVSLRDDHRATLDAYASVIHEPTFYPALDRALPGSWKRVGSDPIRVRPLRVHESRCSFEIEVATKTGWRTLIGKVYASDRSDVFEAMRALADSGFGTGTRLAIPEPVAYLRAMNVLLQEKAEGVSVLRVLETGDAADRQDAVARAAGWLARFHSLAPRQGLASLHDDILRKAKLYADQIPPSEEVIKARCAELVRRLEALEPDLTPVQPCGGHGSFHPIHVLLCGTRTLVIDLDEYGVRDPAWDLAWFVVGLKRQGLRLGGSLRSYDPEVRAFLEVYEDAHPGWAANLPFYEAVECIHRARTDLIKRDPPERATAARMLEEGFRALRAS